jgi:wyosine [tRNA(Phe)-imidazoG37] synthetase (radical SAM superfamily)
LDELGAASNQRHLSVADHDRDFAGLKYVYPVVSRRAGGVSIGINLNPNNACNWRCVYCQVPDLSRGAAPDLELPQLELELRRMLDAVCRGSYLQEHAPPESRVIKDLAISGNGEPTSCPQFTQVIECIGRLRLEYAIAESVKLVLITNGSLIGKPEVQEGLRLLASHGGEVWFKLDRGTDAALRATNGTATTVAHQVQRLGIAARLCRTYVQSCWYTLAGDEPTPAEVEAYVGCLEQARTSGIPIAGVQLYTLARKPQLQEGQALGAVSADWISSLAKRLTRLGLRVIVAV